MAPDQNVLLRIPSRLRVGRRALLIPYGYQLPHVITTHVPHSILVWAKYPHFARPTCTLVTQHVADHLNVHMHRCFAYRRYVCILYHNSSIIIAVERWPITVWDQMIERRSHRVVSEIFMGWYIGDFWRYRDFESDHYWAYKLVRYGCWEEPCLWILWEREWNRIITWDIQKSAAPAVRPCIRPVTSCTSVTGVTTGDWVIVYESTYVIQLGDSVSVTSSVQKD